MQERKGRGGEVIASNYMQTSIHQVILSGRVVGAFFNGVFRKKGGAACCDSLTPHQNGKVK